MKMNIKKLMPHLVIFIFGVVLGGATIFFLVADTSRQLITYHSISIASYNVSKDTRLLFNLQNSEVDKAINSLELDLDVAIVELHSRLKNNEISSEDKYKIKDKLKYAKKYRSEYPRVFKDAEAKKMVEDCLSNISN